MAAVPDQDAKRIDKVLKLLNLHYQSFVQVKPYADEYKQPHPTDTRAWSQIIVSALTGIPGAGRKKGPDLADGSDVKAANVWDAIDTPRFNGCIKAGTKAETAGSIESLDSMPNLFFVLWDTAENTSQKRCRIWVVRPPHDEEFRRMAGEWYDKRRSGEIISNNFQLHPPRNLDSNVFRNTCGNLEYPLVLDARLVNDRFEVFAYEPKALTEGVCAPAD